MCKVLVLIVLYKKEISSSSSFVSLEKNKSNLNFDWHLLIYNNSPDIYVDLIEGVTVENSVENVKLSGAYNFALKYANENDFDWILLVDDDTEFTEEYFVKLSEFMGGNNDREIVAVIPKLSQNDIYLSPHEIYFFNLKLNKISKAGVLSSHITAFNSLSLLKVSFLKSIGGFSEKFPLDMLDYWVYYQIYKAKKKVFLLDTVVQHELSLMNFEKNMTIERYKSLLLSEKKYILEFNKLHYVAYKIRLLYRTLKQLVLYKNKQFSKATFKSFIRIK